MFTIILHLYYNDSWESLFREKLLRIDEFEFDLFVNISLEADTALVAQEIRDSFPKAYIIETPNKGKDVGGKLAIIDLILRLGIYKEYAVFLHDKKSPQATTGDVWREKLLRIIDPEVIRSTIADFSANRKLGIVGSKDFLMNEFISHSNTFQTANVTILKELKERFSLSLSDYRFIGGTMFWIRFAPLAKFFARHPALACRSTLEEGTVLDEEQGTYTHAWERIFCWIATAQGYQIKGI